jgi:hypothetical protein
MVHPSTTLLCLLLSAAAAADPAVDGGGGMSFLDNGQIRIGVDTLRGGAVTWLSGPAHPGNLINSYDLGRQIQMSHYSGPVPYALPGKQPKHEWAGLGWNPIQTGDAFGHPAQVRKIRNDGRELYVQCVPMQWPLDGVPGDCVFESWTTLDGPSARMRFRLTNQRTDHARYPARPQELPAIYTIARLHRLFTYAGDQPFTGAPLTQIVNDWHQPWPWTRRTATERWIAMVDDGDWGLGVFSDQAGVFDCGLYGAPGSEDVHDSSTAYVAPVRIETLDHDIVYDYGVELRLGTLAELRIRFTAEASRDLPAWSFVGDRQHWHAEGGLDDGPPTAAGWRIACAAGHPRLVGPVRCWRAEAAPVVEVEAAWHGPASAARLHWRGLGDESWTPERSVPLELVADGGFHRYRLDLAAVPAYRGLITGLAIAPAVAAQPGSWFALRSVAMRAPGQP